MRPQQSQQQSLQQSPQQRAATCADRSPTSCATHRWRLDAEAAVVVLLPVTRQHTSAYVSIRQHTSAYVSIRQHTSACAGGGGGAVACIVNDAGKVATRLTYPGAC
jgi:hypothetical protein